MMQVAIAPSFDQQRIEAAVMIHRPPTEVFSFCRDLRNLPRYLGDVMRVDRLDTVTYRWTIAGPLGTRMSSLVKVTEEHPNLRLRYETMTSPRWKTSWQIRFTKGPGASDTEVRETMEMPLGRLGRLGLAMIGKYPSHEVRSNLNRLKQLLETGRVRDQSYAVRGKFSQP